MGRSHPPSLIRLAERLILDEALFSRGDVVLCACSGGPDSTAMLHVLAHLRPRLGHELVAHGVDHGLRAEAPGELELARRVADAASVPFAVTRVDVAGIGNLQARARAARHTALAAAAVRVGARVIATAHTADDRAETVLLRLLRGAGPRGLAALPPRAPLPPCDNHVGPGEPVGAIELVRPLLRARRADVLAHIARHGLAVAHDPSNLDPRFTRVRVRREVLPLLEELSPHIVEHLSALADMLSGGQVPSDALAGLGRAQRQAVEHARRMGRRSVRLLVHGGEEVVVTFPGPGAVRIEAASEGELRSRPPRPGSAT